MIGYVFGYLVGRALREIVTYPYWRDDRDRALRWVRNRTPRGRYDVALRRELRAIETEPDGESWRPTWRLETPEGDAARARHDEIVRELISRGAL